MPRPDLAALTPEVLASLSNVGLVKRAQKEKVTVEELPDGTVVGTFADGVMARWPPNVGLSGTSCTCGAATICRHRLALPLNYQGESTSRCRTPKDIAAADLDKVLSKGMLERARAALRQTVTIELAVDPVPLARLPTCTVRFHVPDTLAYARCDCRDGTGCEHLALALWAWHTADRWPTVVTLGGKQSAAEQPLAALRELTELLLSTGVTGASGLGARFEAVRRGLEDARMVWLAYLVDDLEAAVSAWHKRSARYRPERVVDLLTEAEVRRRAALREGELPASLVLGTDVARETALRQVRVISLGAQVEAQDGEREVTVYLTDPVNGEVLILQKSFPDDGKPLGGRLMGPGVRLSALSQGQLISRVARRQANRRLKLGQGRAGETSVVPQTGDWGGLLSPLLIRRLSEFRQQAGREPPSHLRPRVLGGGLHVLAVASSEPAEYRAGTQEVRVRVADAEGETLDLVAVYRKATPWALQTLATAAPLRFVSGFMRPGGREMRPLTLVTDRAVIALDLVEQDPKVLLQPGGSDRESRDDGLDEARSVLSSAVHQGLAGGDWQRRAEGLAMRLEEAGWAELAGRFRMLGTGREWLNAAVRCYLTASMAGAGEPGR